MEWAIRYVLALSVSTLSLNPEEIISEVQVPHL